MPGQLLPHLISHRPQPHPGQTRRPHLDVIAVVRGRRRARRSPPCAWCRRSTPLAPGPPIVISQCRIGPYVVSGHIPLWCLAILGPIHRPRHAVYARCVTRLSWSDRNEAVPKIVTVAAAKGGVGKTTLAYELAQVLEAPLVDLDWDEGGATRRWGYRHEDRVRAPLLAALESGRTPAARRGSNQSRGPCSRTTAAGPATPRPAVFGEKPHRASRISLASARANLHMLPRLGRHTDI
jgi:hypothetical protein